VGKKKSMANPTLTIVGRLGQDPEQIGSNGLRLRVVSNDRTRNDSTGEWEDKNTSWWTVKAWKSLADQSKAVLKKGQEVIIVGKIYEENWTDSSGNKRTSYEIMAESIAVTTYSLLKNIDKSSRDEQFPSSKTYAEVPF
jgi:single-strand DNA-binding protein